VKEKVLRHTAVKRRLIRRQKKFQNFLMTKFLLRDPAP